MDDKKQAFEDYLSLQDLLEYKTLVKNGIYQGNKFESISKFMKFIDKTYEESIKKIEENPWYKKEFKEMSKLNLAELVADGEEYDPDFKLTMHDVFGNNKGF
jgi:hypothetical protein